MRHKALLASALALAPTTLLAAEWETGVGGHLNIGAGYADPGGSDDSVAIFRDGEVDVRGRLTADNGLVFGARVQLEAFTTGDQIDENYGTVSGPLGTFLIGGADTALNEHGGVGVVYPTGDYLNYYNSDSNPIPGDPGSFIGEEDAVSVRYYYALNGFEAGISYQPNAGADGLGGDTNDPVFRNNDQYAVGASYQGDFGDFGFAVGGGYLANDDEDQYHGGLEAGFSGFTLAGFYDRENPDGVSPDDLERYGIGAQYAIGLWTVGGGYVLTNGMNGTNDQEFVHVGGSYNLAPGVIGRAAVQYGEDENDIDGAGAFTWLSLVF